MRFTLFLKRFRTLVALYLLVLSTQVRAITPCPPSPCSDETSIGCEQETDWIAEGVITEIHYRSFDTYRGMPQIPGRVVENYKARAISIKFLPEKTLKGEAPDGESTLALIGCYYQLPGIEHMRPLRMTVRVRKGADYQGLISYKSGPARAAQ
jgi:hypothetical protein